MATATSYKLPSIDDSILGPLPGDNAAMSADVLTTWFGAIAFAILTLFVFVGIRQKATGRALLVACAATSSALAGPLLTQDRLIIDVLDLLAGGAWMGVVLRALGANLGWRARPGLEQQQRLARATVLVVLAALVGVVALRQYGFYFFSGPREDTWVFGIKLAMGLVGLVLVEQLTRNTRRDFQWNMKFMSTAIGMMFAIDFFLYADAVLFAKPSSMLTEIRPIVFALAVPLVIIASGRNRGHVLNVNLSRQFVFRTGVMLAAGGYLVVISMAGYYLRLFGGQWGGVMQGSFVVVALMALAVLASSTQLRNWVWVTISRNLYEYKYDYRDEWRRLTERLADSDADRTLGESVIIGMSDIVHSPAGALWLSDGAERWLPDTQHGCSWDFQLAPEDQQQLRDFFAEREWIIDLKQLRADPKHYPDLRLSGELLEVPQLRFLLPLQVESELVGLLMLAEPRIPIDLIWEDYDLLKVAARQVANALSQSRASEALSYAREFEAFHQMSAFVVHDLKTVVAQLSLMVQNAEKHRTNPAFFDDMISTNANAVDRMQRLLQQLREPARNDQTRINAVAVVAQAIARHDANQPPPSLSSSSPELYCEADEERLTAVIGHIISNAQDACDADGQITARISADQQWLKIEIQDNGCGMDEEFLRKRLFQPFESTKGIAGMGVGVYQTREYLRSLGGNLQVSSTVGSGSTFVLTLPVSR